MNAQQPLYVLRGSSSPIHAIRFHKGNTRLLTGDAEGWIVMWDLVSKRPKAVWRAHSEPVLKVDVWGGDKILTHGRDHKLQVWTITSDDEKSLDTALPLEKLETRRVPSLAHSLDVNAMNFCAFSMLRSDTSDVLIAVPNSVDSEAVDILQLPNKSRAHEKVGKSLVKTGICMALHLFRRGNRLNLLVGYESGHVRTFSLSDSSWEEMYSTQCHSQPVLSLDINPNGESFYTSSADALIAQHRFDGSEPTIVNTHHSGQQSLTVRSDGRIFATAGWDAKARIYSTVKMKELAALKWHREGCYAVALGEVRAAAVEEAAAADGAAAEPTTSTDIVSPGDRRKRATSETHWLAIGSKDGKVSLWNIY